MSGAEFWDLIIVTVFPVVAAIIGGIAYWLRTVDDRQFNMATNHVTKKDLVEALKPIHERLTRIESSLHQQKFGR